MDPTLCYHRMVAAEREAYSLRGEVRLLRDTLHTQAQMSLTLQQAYRDLRAQGLDSKNSRELEQANYHIKTLQDLNRLQADTIRDLRAQLDAQKGL